MALDVKIHAAQTSILRELLFHPSAGYAELQKPTGLGSDHFNFHVKRLVEIGLVEKAAPGRYALTLRGKEYANKLDTDNNTIERQPKVAVLLAVSRERNGHREFLFQERTKHPYYGYWGFPTGKVRWGESIVETAARELWEEARLQADHALAGIYHERTYQRETGEQLEDKIFFVIRCTAASGELMAEFEGGRNRWATAEEARRQKVYTSFTTELAIAQGQASFVEEVHRYGAGEF